MASRFFAILLVTGLAAASCGGSSGSGSGGAGGNPGGSAGQSGSGAGGSAGSANPFAAQCILEGCKDHADCAGCKEYCEATCNADGCGGPGCPVPYVMACFAGKTCEQITSQNELLKDPEVYGCLEGQPFNEVCQFQGTSRTNCWKCTYELCGAELKTCHDDPECQKWLACISNQECPVAAVPNNPACYRECDDKFPSVAALYKPIYACTCAGCQLCKPHQAGCSVTQ